MYICHFQNSVALSTLNGTLDRELLFYLYFLSWILL